MIALPACSGTAGTPGTSTFSTDYSSGYLGSPIDAVLQADGGYLAQEQAIYDFRKSCMQDAGFEFNAPRPSVENLFEDRSPRLKPLLIDDATSDGFRSLMTPSDEGTQPSVQSVEYEANLKSCTLAAPAFQAVQSEEYAAFRRKFFEKYYAFEARYKADKDVAALNKEWSSCASEAGYESDSPGEFLDKYSPSDSALPVTETERSAAIAYASCLKSVGYIEREAPIRRQREAAFVTENEELIHEMLAARYGG